MRLFKNVSLFLVILFFVACATTGYKTTYIQMEKEWMAIAADYKAYKDAGLVVKKDQEVIEDLLKDSSTALDLYKIAVLSGEPTDELILKIEGLKRQILIELAKRRY